MFHQLDRSPESLKLYSAASLFLLLFNLSIIAGSPSVTSTRPALQLQAATEQTENIIRSCPVFPLYQAAENRQCAIPTQHSFFGNESLRDFLKFQLGSVTESFLYLPIPLPTFRDKRQSSFHPHSTNLDASDSPSDTRLG